MEAIVVHGGSWNVEAAVLSPVTQDSGPSESVTIGAKDLAKLLQRRILFLPQSMLNRSSFACGALKNTSKYYTRSRTYTQQANNGSEPKMADSRSAEDFIDLAEELDVSGQGGKRGTRGGRVKAGGGGGRGIRAGGSVGGEMNRDVTISKALSKLLRHAAVDAGLKLDPEGFARVDQVMQWQRLKSLRVTFEDIRTATTESAKQRFSMKPNPALNPPPDSSSEQPSDWVIRANQGHSITVDSAALLTPVTIGSDNVPDVVVHGTYFGVYQAILDTGGLNKMSRNHIHFSTGLPESKHGVISGMRNDAELLIYVDIKKSLEDGGILWWISDNGVILTEGDENGSLGTKYWKKVEGRKQNVGLLWEDGEQVGELPLNLKSKRPPRGKGSRAPNPKERSAKLDGKWKEKLIKPPHGLASKEAHEDSGP